MRIIDGSNLLDQRRINMATYQQWSQSYFPDLTLEQHDVNNQWFQCMRDRLTSNGILYVPILDKEFSKSGKEVNNDR